MTPTHASLTLRLCLIALPPAAQLALRDIELRACSDVSITTRDGTDQSDGPPLSAGSRIQVHVEKEGHKLWTPAVVVAVWHNGGFRVQVGTDCEWVEDFPSPMSPQGRRLRGREWRLLHAPPAAQPQAARPQRELRSAQAKDSDVDGASAGGNGGAGVAPGRSATQLGRSLVGVRVSVWWEEDEVWYDGTIRAFDDVMGEHLVAYDDGDQVHEVLDKCRCACCAIGGYAIGGCWCARRASLAHYRLCSARAPLLWCPQVEDGPWWHEDSRARDQEAAQHPTKPCCTMQETEGTRNAWRLDGGKEASACQPAWPSQGEEAEL